MRAACIYHGIDLDGWMGGAIVAKKFLEGELAETDPNTQDLSITLERIVRTEKESGEVLDVLEMIPYNYGQPIPDLQAYEMVVMVDISFPKDVMTQLLDRLDTGLIWIDHHISAMKDILGEESLLAYVDGRGVTMYDDQSTAINGLRDTSKAGCELAWHFFFNHFDRMPEIVHLLGRYDCFGHKGTSEEQQVLEFQYAARGEISNWLEAYEGIKYSGRQTEFARGQEDVFRMQIQEKGKAIYKFLCTEAQHTMKNTFPILLKEGTIERKFLAVNKDRFNPINFGITYHDQGYDGFCCFHMTKEGKFAFSFYNDNGVVDCSVIAKSFGGGGHAGAAGCMVKDPHIVLHRA